MFVFAITQVTGYLADNSTWVGLLEGLFLLGALWWAWAAYAWLTNTLDPEEGVVRLAVFGSMAAMLVVGLAVPNAFGSDGVIFGVAYFVVRSLHLVLYVIASRGDPALQRAVITIIPTAIAGPALLVLAGFLEGPAQLVDLGRCACARLRRCARRASPGMARRTGSFRRAPRPDRDHRAGRVHRRHWPRRGGSSARRGPIGASVLGVVVACSIWWSYFDWVTYIAQARLAQATGVERAALARDLYSYLHLPMVAGIVLFALGMKTTTAHLTDPLSIIPAIGLCGGLALYLAAHIAARLRIGGGLGHGRPVATVALVALIPVALAIPALISLGLVTAVMVALIAYEYFRYRRHRTWIRSHRGGFTHDEAIEAGRALSGQTEGTPEP